MLEKTCPCGAIKQINQIGTSFSDESVKSVKSPQSGMLNKEKLNVEMEIRLKRYYGDASVTKSVTEVWMDGEDEPRLVCEAREPEFREYSEAFPGASRFCLPVGRWKLAVGGGPYSPMGVRVARCPGHRQVYFGYGLRECEPDRVLVGWPVFHYYTDEVTGERVEYPPKRRMRDGEEVFEQLDKLVYEAYGREEEMWVIIDN